MYVCISNLYSGFFLAKGLFSFEFDISALVVDDDYKFVFDKKFTK